MINHYKRVISSLLIVLMLFMSVAVNANAQDIEAEGNVQETDVKENVNSEDIPVSPEKDSGDQEQKQEIVTNDNTENVEESDEEESNKNLGGMSIEDDFTNTDSGNNEKIEYLYVDETEINIPETQYIVVGLLDKSINIENAILHYSSKTTGESYEIIASTIQDGVMLFTKDYVEEDAEDEFQFDSITYKTSELEENIDLHNEGFESGYKVLKHTEDNSNDNSEVTVYATGISSEAEKSGNSVENTVEDALNEVKVGEDSGTNLSRSAKSSRSVNKTIVICAGHDSTHTGAHSNGLSEEELTYKVATYCKEELEQYEGVTVYLDRNSVSCKYPGQSTSYCVNQRPKDAAALGASTFVDIHFNTGGGTGSEVYYPNISYNANISADGQNLSNRILEELSKLGLKNRGAKIRNTTQGTTDPWGNPNDYYATNYLCKQLGLTGIIVEHAFLDNAADAQKLKNETFIQSLGVADATGIANAYGLTKGKPSLMVEGRNDFSGVFTLVGKNVTSSNGKIPMVCVWSDESGNDDAKWYQLKQGADGRYTADVKISDHGNETGTYSAHMYYQFPDNTYSNFLGGAQVEIYPSQANISSSLNGENRLINVEVTNPAADLKKLKIAVWKGNGSISWIEGAKKSEVSNKQDWQVEINQSNYDYGEYNVHVYAELADGTMAYAGATSFKVTSPSAKVGIDNINPDTGTFEVNISDIEAPRGIKGVQVFIWSDENQSNMYVYSAQKSGNIYKVEGKLSNHNYKSGDYNVHVYLTDNRGQQTFVGAQSFEAKAKDLTITAQPDWNTGNITLVAKNLGVYNQANKIEFAVWNDNEGMSTLKWYDGNRKVENSWEKKLSVQECGSYGNYNVHIYASYLDGTKVFVGATNFFVPAPKANISVNAINGNAGTYQMVIENIECVKGFQEIRVGTWCSTSTESLMWYTAHKQSDGTYTVDVNAKNHLNLAGDYISHVYLLDKNGNMQFLGGVETQLKAATPKISATFDNNLRKAEVSIDNLNLYGGVKKVRYAVWCNDGNNSIVWYQGINKNNWPSEIDMKNHKNYGTYNVHVYATQGNGQEIFVGAANFSVPNPTGKVASETDNSNAVIKVTDIQAPYGVMGVECAVWGRKDQSDLKWHSMERKSDGNYMSDISLDEGEYNIHVYLNDEFKNKVFIGATTCKIGKGEIKETKITANLEIKNAQVNLGAENVSSMYKQVKFAVWNESLGSNDIKWYTGNTDSKKWTAKASLTGQTGYGVFNVHTYGVTSTGDSVYLGGTTFDLPYPSAEINQQNLTDISTEIIISNIVSAKGVKQIRVPVWSTENQSNIYWYDAKLQSDGSYKAEINISNHKNLTGNYNIHVYLYDGQGNSIILGCKTASFSGKLYAIMGSPQATVEQMVNCYKEVVNSIHKQYPAKELAVGNAPTIESFCEIYYEEAMAEGVAPEVVFAQSMVETGWLQFGGQVNVSQFNFAGIGATDGGASGASFSDVRTGVRAQVQHLKAYASKEDLNNACVDPRFGYVTRESAPYVEWLGVQENPYHLGWATGAGYGSKIINVISKIKQY